MKTLQILFLGLLVGALRVTAQDDSDPWRIQPIVSIPVLTPDTNSGAQANAQFQANSSSSSPGYAEANSTNIQALAVGLQNDPVKIFNYVHDHIKFVLYYGSLKGAELTLLEQSGNDFDQCALLVALLQAAGYSPGYGFGLQKIPYQATDGTANDLQHWWQLNLTSNNWSNVNGYIKQLVAQRGYYVYFDMGDNNHVAFQRVWVTVAISGITYNLDPAFKISQPVAALSGFSLATGIGSSTVNSDLLSAAAGTDNTNYTQNLNEPAVRSKLTAYTTNLLSYLQNNFPNASVQDVVGGWQIVPTTNTTLSQSLLFATFTANNAYPLQTWGSIPTNFMSTLNVAFAGTNQSWFMPQLAGQGLSLSFDSSGKAILWLGSSTVLQSTNTGSGLSTTVTLTAKHPFGGWNSANQVPTDSGWADQSLSRPYQRTNANYAIMYGFETSLKWLNSLQQQLDICRQSYSNSSPQVVNGTLNVMGMNWLAQTELAHDLMCQQVGLLPEFHHRIGRMAQEAGHGYYVDVYMQQDQTFPSTGTATEDYQKQSLVFDSSCYFWSALEHGVIEQMQNTNLVGASTIKMLQIANTNGQAVYLITSTNWSTVSGSITNYGSLTNSFTSLVSQGWVLLVPQNGANTVAGTGTWKGDGYVQLLATSTQRGLGMVIGGSYNGGYVSDPTAFVNPDYTSLTVVNQPTYFNLTPIYTPSFTTADPVDTVNGTFQVENTDLSIGQAEPRGITLSRFYNGTRRFNSAGGLTPGWIHNYCATANNVAAPQAGLGGTTPTQMASMLVASYAALNLYNNTQPNPKNWLTTALIAKWGVDQLIKNGVSVSLGKDTVQFVKQPNGVFTPPANCTMALVQTNSSFWLKMRHGNTFKFNSAGYLTNIVNQYSQPLSLTYNASNWVSTVKDWKNRTFTFTYSGTPSRLASVTDGARTVSYGYSTTYNSQGDLTSFTDAESKTSTYAYDTNHEVTGTFDALSRLVVSNLYDGGGHVATQYTQGDTNKTWRIFWSGWQTVSQDPAGAQTTFFYDDKSRLIGQQDALGNMIQTFYDGQNHITQTVLPMGETNSSVFDASHNLIQKTDALGYTNQFFYDAQNNLTRAVDPLGNPTTFGYNSQFSLTGQTNGAGDWVNYTYNSDGTLHTRADSGGTTTYGYDSTYGQLSSITYPGSLGSESFANSSFGDITNHTDARGFATSFKYNNRHQLTNTVAPTNLTAKVSLDAVGNAVSRIDSRGNTNSYSWSVTRHLVSATLPNTPQGSPVITNFFDNRDILIRTKDALGNSTFYTNDIAGRLVSVADPAQRTTRFGYDLNGRKIAVTNAAQEVTRQTWDARGNLIKVTDGANHVSTRVYDAAGNQITLTNRNGKKWQFQFDGANRLTKNITPLNRSTTLTFNHQGLVSTITDPANQLTSLYYDAKGRLTNRTDNVASTLYSFDANDNPTSVVESGKTNAWTYDAYNRAQTYRDTAGNLIQYRYDQAGNLTNLIYPGGKNVFYAYDNLNQMTNVTDWSGRKTQIGYDLNGRVTSIVRPNGSYRTIGYDVAGQATNILEQMSNSLPIAIFKHGWTNSGTMAWEFAAPLPHVATVATRTMTYDDDNRLATVNGASVTNDLDGNLTYAPLTNSALGFYVYDARNRLLNAGGVINTYDALDNRVDLTNGTNSTALVVNPNAKLPQVLIRIKTGVTNYYIYGAGLLYQITETATATNTLTYHYDYRGSTIALSADSGVVTDRIEYSSYGLVTYRVGLTDTPFLFNGRYGVQTDANGLLYMRARYYNPYLCRFVSADPSGFAGGLNHYAYANGNPVSYFDPFGLGAIGENSSSSWIMNGVTGTLSDIGNTFVNSAYSTANMMNSAVMQVGNTVLTGLGILGAAQQTVLSAVGINDPMMLGPAGGAVEGEMAALRGLGALAAETTLPANIASTFSRGAYTSTILQEDMIAYRYSGGMSRPTGQFLTTADTVSQISSPVSASIALNLPAGATAQTLNTFTIPAGTRIFSGSVAGGADTATQIFIQNPSVLIPH